MDDKTAKELIRELRRQRQVTQGEPVKNLVSSLGKLMPKKKPSFNGLGISNKYLYQVRPKSQGRFF